MVHFYIAAWMNQDDIQPDSTHTSKPNFQFTGNTQKRISQWLMRKRSRNTEYGKSSPRQLAQTLQKNKEKVWRTSSTRRLSNQMQYVNLDWILMLEKATRKNWNYWILGHRTIIFNFLRYNIIVITGKCPYSGVKCSEVWNVRERE